MPRRPQSAGVTQLGAGSAGGSPRPLAGWRADSRRITPRDTSGCCTAPQTLILDGFPTIGEVKLLGPNSGTANRYALAAYRKRVQHWVKVEVSVQMIRPVPPPVIVTLRYVMPDARHRDADNFAAIGKPVIDGLVKSQILAGDNAARLTQRVEFVKERGQRRLEITIAPANPGSGGEGEA